MLLHGSGFGPQLHGSYRRAECNRPECCEIQTSTGGAPPIPDRAGLTRPWRRYWAQAAYYRPECWYRRRSSTALAFEFIDLLRCRTNLEGIPKFHGFANPCFGIDEGWRSDCRLERCQNLLIEAPPVVPGTGFQLSVKGGRNGLQSDGSHIATILVASVSAVNPRRPASRNRDRSRGCIGRLPVPKSGRVARPVFASPRR